MSDASPLQRHAHLIAIAILILGLLFYLYRIDRWFMDDDEGGFCYAAWRISKGEVPYRDFLTEQVPLFLYWGGAVVRLFGPSIMALRYATVLATLLAAFFIYLTARHVYGCQVALLSLSLLLVHKDIYFIARFFRPEAYMLLLTALGAYSFVRAYPGRGWGLFLSGALFGLATLCKLFAVLPAAGCGLFLLYQWHRSRERQLMGDLLALAASFGAIAGTVFVACQLNHPIFLTAVFKLHVMQGAELSLLQVLAKGFKFYWSYLMGNPVFVLLAMLGAAGVVATQADIGMLYVWQMPTAAVFLALSRSLLERHLVYLVPVLCVLAALSLERILAGSLFSFTSQRSTTQSKPAVAWIWVGLGIAVAAVTVWPSWRGDMEVAGLEELETPHLAQYIQAHTAADDVVLCDYPGLNFHALRKNTYLGADLSGVTTSSGQITGAALIKEIEGENVQMVWINTYGGAHHLVNLRDYGTFYQYVQSHFQLVGLFRCSYQTFEVYDRRDLMPFLPGAEFGGKLALTGADVRSEAIPAGQALSVTLRWQALQPMARDYTVSLRLTDEQGHRYGQKDMPLERLFTCGWVGNQEIIARAPTSQWPSSMQVIDGYVLPVAHGTAPGTYWLAVLLYDLASGEVLQAHDAQGDVRGIEYPLIRVEVIRPDHAPTTDELDIHRQVMQDFSGDLRLLGHGPLVEAARPGDSLHLVLFWQALRAMESNWQLLIRIQSADGAIATRGQFDLANPGHPTSQWVEGEVVRGQYDLVLDRTAPTGQAQILIDLVDAETGRRLLGHDWLLASLHIEGRPRQFELPSSVQHPLTANLGNCVRLLGYDLDEATVRAGSILELILYWQTLAEMDTSYTVFTHLLDAQEQMWGQMDSMPVQGTYPTTGWVSGEVIVDAYRIEVKKGAPPGEYALEVGLYNAATGERLPVLNSSGRTVGNRVLVGPVYITQ